MFLFLKNWLYCLFIKLCPGCNALLNQQEDNSKSLSTLLCKKCQSDFTLFTNPSCLICCQNRRECFLCADLTKSPALQNITCFQASSSISNMLAKAANPKGWYLLKALASCFTARLLIHVKNYDYLIALPDKQWKKGSRANFQLARIMAKTFKIKAVPFWQARFLAFFYPLSSKRKLFVGLSSTDQELAKLPLLFPTWKINTLIGILKPGNEKTQK